MKIVLICPSNMLYMPYVDNYVTILKENNADYTIINWDRFGIEEKTEFTYRDRKVGHQRSFFDYCRYKQFIVKHLKEVKYEKIIVFGIQLTFFLKNILLKNFKRNYIIDIRDYNKIINYFNINMLIDNSSFTVLSSEGYKEWLPNSNKYIINHNTQIKFLDDIGCSEINFNKDKINIAYIGAIRDYQVNVDLINSLRNNNWIDIYFHGEGNINEDIQKYIDSNSIKNVYLTGRYIREDEEKLYTASDLINVLRYNDGVNNKTALPNRLYNAVIYGKPMLAYHGTYLADIIQKYNLGLVLSSFDNITEILKDYFINFNQEKYYESRHEFLNYVITQNRLFNEKLESFIKI